MRDAARQQADIQAGGARIVFLHLSSEAQAKRFFGKYGMGDVERISDPEGKLYEEFGLNRAGVKELLSPSVWLRGLTAIFTGNAPGIPRGDTLRMPGAFLVNRGEVSASFFHKTIADRPNLKSIMETGVEACRT